MNFFRTTDTTDTTIWKPGCKLNYRAKANLHIIVRIAPNRAWVGRSLLLLTFRCCFYIIVRSIFWAIGAIHDMETKWKSFDESQSFAMFFLFWIAFVFQYPDKTWFKLMLNCLMCFSMFFACITCQMFIRFTKYNYKKKHVIWLVVYKGKKVETRTVFKTLQTRLAPCTPERHCVGMLLLKETFLYSSSFNRKCCTLTKWT